MIKIYGIKNCDTMKKAFDQLALQHIDYEFHDYKKQGIDLETLQGWADQVGLDTLLNKKGTTWRKFSPDEQAEILSSPQTSLQALAEYTSLIKRPVLVIDDKVIVGFDAKIYENL